MKSGIRRRAEENEKYDEKYIDEKQKEVIRGNIEESGMRRGNN